MIGSCSHYLSLLLLYLSNCFSFGFSILNMASQQPNAAAVSLPNLDKLTTYAISYAASHGIQVEKKIQGSSAAQTNALTSYICAPISLLPNAFPSYAFHSAIELAPAFNLLVDRMSRDADFLERALAGDSSRSVISSDSYTRKLYELYRSIYCDGDDSKTNFGPLADRLGIHRSDYMLHPLRDISDMRDNNYASPEGFLYDIKQVELNTIAASFAGLSVQVADMHRMITQRFYREIQPWLQENEKVINGVVKAVPESTIQKGVPENPALVGLPKAIYLAHQRYVERFISTTRSEPAHSLNQPVVLFIVQEGETNTVDQRLLEFHLLKNHGLSVIRMSLTKAFTQMNLNSVTGALYVKEEEQEREVSIVYFRAGYAPTDYPDGLDGIEWKARDILERSRATKCPCIGYHLAGTKKVQQSVAKPGVLERFFNIKDPVEQEMVRKMRKSFAGLYSLGDDATEVDLQVVKDVVLLGQEGSYVLKPQREGGGYNYYNQVLAKKLQENVQITEDGSKVILNSSLAEFILMERLFPPSQNAILIRGGLVEGIGKTISELGCFGSIVVSHDGSEIMYNEYSGFLLRTKFSGVDEGGVASGFATLSSPYLC